MAAQRQHAHDLLDQIDAAQFEAVVKLLELLLSRDEDRDTISDTERKAIAEADEWLNNKQPIPTSKDSRSLD